MLVDARAKAHMAETQSNDYGAAMRHVLNSDEHLKFSYLAESSARRDRGRQAARLDFGDGTSNPERQLPARK
jgi:hypothetical protein